jgi:hypothetical protein
MVSVGDKTVSPLPAWLADLAVVDPWTDNTFADLYDIFTRDFKQSRPSLDGYEVWFFPELEDGIEKIFWHLTHRDNDAAGERLPDTQRCEKLPWVRCILENVARPEVLFWDYVESDGSTHTYAWLRDYDFVVILKKYRRGIRRLLTAFHIDHESYRRNLRSKYEKRV